MSSYEVSTSVFEGPFDLLLHLILKQEVDLWEISLSRIVDEYLTELERMEGLDLDVTTEFLLIAATLVDLKARRLLPSLEEVELDEELLRFEERDLLLARLLECKTFKDAANAMATLVRRADRSLERSRPSGPIRSTGWRRRPCWRRRCAAWHRNPRRPSRSSTSRRSAPACATRSRSCSRCYPNAGR
jgi:chromatin segregation and condensation protein Rec8/ScpA/Scc1 (kleisin family)